MPESSAPPKIFRGYIYVSRYYFQSITCIRKIASSASNQQCKNYLLTCEYRLNKKIRFYSIRSFFNYLQVFFDQHLMCLVQLKVVVRNK